MARIRPDQARRIALAAQGFCDPKPSAGVTVRQLRRVMDRMAVLQLDSVNVVCRSHYLPVLARLGPYDRDKLNTYLYRSGEHFEYFSHEASLTSQDHQPLLRHRMRSKRWTWVAEMEREMPGYLQAVHDEVAERGPISIEQLSDPGNRTGPWWGMPKGKRALAGLYHTGRLAIADRDHRFITQFDLPERVLRPDVLAAPEPDQAEAKRQLLLVSARSHGIGTATDLADYYRLKVSECRPLLADLVEAGELEQVDVDGWDDPVYLHPEARRPRAVPGAALLSPFDPVVWCRDRAERLFDFFYRIEIYVPEAKRVHGYYVLPFLLDGELVGRVDLKADRHADGGAGLLLARGCFAQPGAAVGGRGSAPAERTARALAGALDEMAEWLGLGGVWVGDRGDLAPALRRHYRSGR